MYYLIINIGFCLAFFSGGMSAIFYNDAKEQKKRKLVTYGVPMLIAVVASVTFTLLLIYIK